MLLHGTTGPRSNVNQIRGITVEWPDPKCCQISSPSDDLPTRYLLPNFVDFAESVTNRRDTTKKIKLECGPVPNVMAAQPNIGGALCKSSIITFLVPSGKVWLTHAAGVPCSLPGVKFTLCPSLAFCYTGSVTGSNAANIAYSRMQALDIKWILHWAKFHQGTKAPENAYIVYHPIRQPNIAQSLVGLRSATSLQ